MGKLWFEFYSTMTMARLLGSSSFDGSAHDQNMGCAVLSTVASASVPSKRDPFCTSRKILEVAPFSLSILATMNSRYHDEFV